MTERAEIARTPAPEADASGVRPWYGYGLGLRTEHFDAVLDESPAVDWFEIISENFMVAGGKPRHYLDAIRARYPLAMHGVSLSIGSTDPLDLDYLRELGQLARDIEPMWISDHLCWTANGGINSHDLMPLPYTEEAIAHVASRIGEVQDFLGREILIENVSTYVSFANAEMDEAAFLSEIARRSGCRILLDVNNIYVSSRNHGYDADAYVAALPAEKIWQIHLAGHSDYGDYVIDTHDHPVRDEVWALYARTLERVGPVTTMIERDDQIPPLAELVAELDRARRIGSAARQPAQAVCA
ncbi:MAG TPA: DUF692 domain-containing protein [Dokdonella sp.]|uniref:MNIO family bufferin maturase n=1 Tax=Dokdonella sp. TaxID=2291710 RepID=UPI002D80A1F2|nr:DUF692 domain-containing protein [Dokdonella sp.]HET9031560.1 DUF692 domain-containing protein [Dokdonella sp.]